MTQIYSVFVSNAADGEIAAYRFDAANGALELETRYADTNVMPLALSPDAATLYAQPRAARRRAWSATRWT